jgi:sodium/bile acid cotransporter 7
MSLIRSNWFVLGILATIALAAALPGPGDPAGPFHPQLATATAVFIIFFINGLILPTETILGGLAKWRVHLFVHVFLFVVTPLLVVTLLLPSRPFLTPSLVSGFILLGALPCAISTSIVYAVRAGGSLAPAIFNATAANLVGVVVTPLIVGFLAPTNSGQGIDIGTALLNTASTVVPPILLGQVARRPIHAWIARHKSSLNNVNSVLILLVIYVAFASSVRDGLWSRLGLPTFALVASLCLVLFVIQIVTAAIAVRRQGFAPDDTVTAFVCSTQKTLAAGIPLANAIFLGTGLDLGAVLLPLLIFYAIQLLTGEAIIRRAVPPPPTPGASS